MRLPVLLSTIAILFCRAESLATEQKAPEDILKRFADSAFLTFPERRENPITRFDGIPEAWLAKRPEELKRMEVPARPGEYFTFQIGVYAHQQGLDALNAQWSVSGEKNGITAKDVTCFNTSGIDFRGKRFRKMVSVPRGHVQPLWFGVRIPRDARGHCRLRCSISASNARETSVDVILKISGKPVENSGFDTGKNLSRLAWLNTTLGENDTVTKGFPPLGRTGRLIRILGRTVRLGPDGLPDQILSFFEPSNQFLLPVGEPLLNGPFHFAVQTDDGNVLNLRPGRLQFTGRTPSAASWRVQSSSPECDLVCSGRMEFDGFAEFSLVLKAKRSVSLRDIRLDVPVRGEKALYMMGLNHEGGLRPSQWTWKWDTTKHQDALWLGAVNGGLRIKWKAENYVRPLINIYYGYGPLRLPPSWGNGGRGGVNVTEEGKTVLVGAYSGGRKLRPGDSLHYDFELLITPFKTIDRTVRFNDRYFHGGGTKTARKIAMADSVGANIINIHHAEDIYPFINYPFMDENVAALKELADNAHRNDKRLKLYYTTRELTKNLPEFWALFSLNGEVLYPGPGNECRTIINPNGPDEWLKRNLKEKYIPAWLNRIQEGPFQGETDLSVITTPDSRLNNFYIGGLDWMLAHLGIDGVYIDDSALDRLTVRRARKLIDHYRPEGRIDFHTWNHFNSMAGWTSCLNLYMDLLPYFDLVWVGEGRDYDRMPDHWLVEVSGIPFGLTGQMLNGGGNPWRGMVYAITNRPGWAGDPSHIWKFWDACRIREMQMIGYWDSTTPATCTNDSVKVSLYRGEKESILAVGNWGSGEQTSTITIDWTRLGYDPSKCTVSIPPIPEFQEGQAPGSLEGLRLPAGKGLLITLKNGARK